jgi:hypothetical protein
VEPFWRSITAISLVLVVVTIVRGRRRGQPRLRILENALFAGLPLMMAFGRYAPVLRRLWLVGLVAVGIGMVVRLFRPTATKPPRPE